MERMLQFFILRLLRFALIPSSASFMDLSRFTPITPRERRSWKQTTMNIIMKIVMIIIIIIMIMMIIVI